MNTGHIEHIENRTLDGILAVRWNDGSEHAFTHAELRVACPCSECRALRRAGGSVEAADAVRLRAIEPAGSNALNLAFSDGHARGIYPFALLAQLVRSPTSAVPIL
jgi:prepilin-type processing-associated H-X9-DG protein